jgi:hypothetical protein
MENRSRDVVYGGEQNGRPTAVPRDFIWPCMHWVV